MSGVDWTAEEDSILESEITQREQPTWRQRIRQRLVPETKSLHHNVWEVVLLLPGTPLQSLYRNRIMNIGEYTI